MDEKRIANRVAHDICASDYAEIKRHIDAATDIALKVVEKEARDILKKHKELDEFIMGMGIWSFTKKGDDNLYGYDDLPYCRDAFKVIDEWDGVLRITGNPMRFTATGKKITDW